LTFCKKSIDIQDALIGKWKIDSVQLRRFINNEIVYQTIYSPTADYYDFRSDDKLYRFWMTSYDTLAYTIVSLNGKSLVQYVYSADTIISLTNHSLIFKDPQGSDSKIFLSK
jgi:hypothetical protein